MGMPSQPIYIHCVHDMKRFEKVQEFLQCSGWSAKIGLVDFAPGRLASELPVRTSTGSDVPPSVRLIFIEWSSHKARHRVKGSLVASEWTEAGLT